MRGNGAAGLPLPPKTSLARVRPCAAIVVWNDGKTSLCKALKERGSLSPTNGVIERMDDAEGR